MDFSFIHIADIHLGRPFSNLSKYCDDEKTKTLYKIGVKKAFEKFVNFAISNCVDFVLIAGDTFDSDNQDLESKLVLKAALEKLSKSNINVYMICGNHDPLNSYNKNTFNFDENSKIKIVGLNCPNNSKFVFYDKENTPCAQIHAISFEENEFRKNPAELLSTLGIEDKKLFNIGLLHCDLNADKTSVYAPCSESDLKNLNYDYWALGHIHLPSLKDEIIQYSGTIQGRNTKETGAHGFRFIKVSNNKIVSNNFINSDVVRYDDIDVDLSECIDSTSAYNEIYSNLKQKFNSDDVDLYLLRVNLVGSISFSKEINEEFYSLTAEKISEEFSQKVCISCFYNNLSLKVDEASLKEDKGLVGEIYNVLQTEENIQSCFDDLCSELKNILSNCDFSQDEFESLKQEVIKEVKNGCLNICNGLYNDENAQGEDE